MRPGWLTATPSGIFPAPPFQINRNLLIVAALCMLPSPTAVFHPPFASPPLPLPSE